MTNKTPIENEPLYVAGGNRSMNTRERLINFRKQLSDHINGRSSCLNASDVALLDKLLAERPYEEKDTIMVKHRGEEFWYEAQYIASCSSGVVALRDGVIDMFSQHKSLHKTYRVTVPEEVIDKAREITASRIDDVVAANEVCACIANPDNWEDDR